MSFWTLDNFRDVTAGRYLKRALDATHEPELRGVSTDTRTIEKSQVFIALCGERFDAHDHLDKAAAAGAALLVVDDEAKAAAAETGNVAVLLVDDTLRAMTRLATAYRKSLNATVIAVTGSVGKTSTKQMIHAVLSAAMRGHAAERSHNNEIGVPLTLLNVEPKDRYVVVEIGTNAPGEIGALAKIVEPDLAVITAVGSAHLERLGSIEGVAEEKAALLRHLRDGGTAIINGDTELLAPYLKITPNVVRFGRSADCELQLTGYDQNADGAHFAVNGKDRYDLPLLGEHNAVNALAAIAVGQVMRMSGGQIAEGLAQTEGADMRLSAGRVGPITVINDAYNANPDSVEAAVAVLAGYPCAGRRVAVLGDMLELGEQSVSLHERVVSRVSGKVDLLVLVGPAMGAARSACVGAELHTVETWDDAAAERVTGLIEAGDVVLLKASRGVGLEKAAESLAKRFDNIE